MSTIHVGLHDFLLTASTLSGRDLIDWLEQFPEQSILKRILYLCYNPYITFNSRVFAKWLNNKYSFPSTEPTKEQLTSLLDRLESGSPRIQEWLEKHPNLNWIVSRIANKNLGCGIAKKTIERVFPSLLPSFSPATPKKSLYDEITFPCYVCPNFQSRRLIWIVGDGRAVAYNKSGTPAKGVAVACQQHMDDFAVDHKDQKFVLDTYFNYDPWNKRKTILVTDLLTTLEWSEAKESRPIEARLSNVSKMIDQYRELRPHSIIFQVEHHLVKNEMQLQYSYLQALLMNTDGVVVKGQEYPFRADDESWKIYSPNYTHKAKVLSFANGYLHCLVYGDFPTQEVQVQSGLREDDLLDYTHNPSQVVGKTCLLLGDKKPTKFMRFLRYVDATEFGSN